MTSERSGFEPAHLHAEAAKGLPDTVALRRLIHAEPELGLDLPRTQEKILAALEGLGLDIVTGTAQSSIVATLKGGGDGPTILLRGDMDALPMPENTGLDFSSTIDNRMHACGHDAHVAMLVGAAKILVDRRAELNGNVKFFFQPGEEGYAGAALALEEGLLADGDVTAGLALHIDPTQRAGSLTTKPGPIMASADELFINIIGKGGHGSSPHGAIDPIVVAATIVTELQTVVTRTVDVFAPAVLTITSFHSGTTTNVIPERVELSGTLRTVSERTRNQMHESIHRVVTGIAAAHGCTAEVEIRVGYPVTENDPEFVAFAADVLRDLVGPENVRITTSPIMGAEDWSYVLQQIPGAMVFLGVRPPELTAQTATACHSNRMMMDEDAMAVGSAAYAAVAMRYLS
ncbi:MAG: M20 family metallopeptidase [Acidimicrobiales bacterium]